MNNFTEESTHRLHSIRDDIITRPNIANGFIQLYMATEFESLYRGANLSNELDSLNQMLAITNETPKQYLIGCIFINLVAEIESYIQEVITIATNQKKEIQGTNIFKTELEKLCGDDFFATNEMTQAWITFAEGRERRHTGVHGKWLASKNYLSRIKNYCTNLPDEGAPLHPTEKYFLNFSSAAQNIIFSAIDFTLTKKS